jgi:hypothetical protein
MNSQIYNILEVIEEIKLLIKDSQYKTTLDDLIQNYKHYYLIKMMKLLFSSICRGD